MNELQSRTKPSTKYIVYIEGKEERKSLEEFASYNPKYKAFMIHIAGYWQRMEFPVGSTVNLNGTDLIISRRHYLGCEGCVLNRPNLNDYDKYVANILCNSTLCRSEDRSDCCSIQYEFKEKTDDQS